MASIIIPSRTRRQPQGPVAVDWGNPLARGLAVWTDSMSSWVPRTQARSINASRFNGSVRGFITTGGQYLFTSTPVTSTEWTTLGEVIAATSGGFQALWSFDNGLTSDSLGVANGAYPSQNFGLDFRPYAADSNSSQVFAVGVPIVCGGTVSVSANQVKGFYNGKLNYSPALSSSASASFDRLSLFSKRNGTDAATSGTRINWVALWTRALSDSEIAALSENPWQLFRPALSNRIFSFPQALYTAIDEPSPPDRADYVEATAANSEYTFTVSSITQPPAGTNIEVNYDATTVEGSLQVEFFQSAGWGVFLSQRWRRQPQGPVAVDWGNPLARGLVSALDIRGGQGRDLCAQSSVIGATDISTGAGLIGVAAKFPGTGAPNFSVTTSNAASYSVGAVVQSYVDNQIQLMVDNDDVTTRIFQFRQNDTNLLEFITFQGGSPYFLTLAWPKRRIGSAVAASASGTVTNLAADGAVQSGTSGSVNAISGSTFVGCSKNSFGRFPWNGLIALAPIWGRALSPGELASWTENPWQLFRPQIPRTYMLPDELRIATKTIPMGVNGTGTLRITPGEYAAVPSWPWTPRVRLTSK